MKANMPEQFLSLRSRPVLHYSLHHFLEKLPRYCAANGLSPPAQVVCVMAEEPAGIPNHRERIRRQVGLHEYGGRAVGIGRERVEQAR
ncbi:hypothetical protein ACHAWF_012785 [Thalassiosira exigua]